MSLVPALAERVDKSLPMPDDGNYSGRESARVNEAAMKLHGIVKGLTIELEGDPDLPDGQRVLVELEIPKAGINAKPLSDRELENRIAKDLAFEDIRQARALRERVAARLEGNLASSVGLVREDRSR